MPLRRNFDQVLVDVADHRGSFTDRGRGALRRARADVSCRVDAGGEAEQRGERETLTILQRHRLELAVGAVQSGDRAAIAHGDAGAIEVGDQVVGHRLAKVGTPVEQCHQGAAPSERDRRLAGGIAAADDADAGARARAGLRRADWVEDGQPLVFLELRERKATVFGAGGDDDRAGGDRAPVLELDSVHCGSALSRGGSWSRITQWHRPQTGSRKQGGSPMPDPDGTTKANEETTPDTSLHAYKEGRQEDIKGDTESFLSEDPQRQQAKDIEGDDELHLHHEKK